MLPNKLKNFTLFVDGYGMAGLVTEISLPKLTRKTDEHDAGGMSAPVEVDLGLEKLTSEITLGELNDTAYGLFGVPDTPFVVRGALKGRDAIVEVVATMRGLFTELDPGSWKKGESDSLKGTVALYYYKLEIGGSTVIEIDPENGVEIIGGTDRLAETRTALGV